MSNLIIIIFVNMISYTAVNGILVLRASIQGLCYVMRQTGKRSFPSPCSIYQANFPAML